MADIKKLIVIVGPTAVGKTSTAIKIAQHYNTEIISADSRQCFKETTIGVAKPSIAELSIINHYFIDSHSIHETVNAGVYEKIALEKVDAIFKTNDIAIVVGGTGLYIKALCEGLDVVPAIDTKIQGEIIENYNLKGLEWLQQEVMQNDELYWQKGEKQNPQRLIRALAVKLSTNESIISFQKNTIIKRPFEIIKIGLHIDKTILHHNINTRVDEMIKNGLLLEAEKLKEFKELNALQTVGYTEIFDYFDGKHSLDKAIELIKIHTRQYAKRQITWFKRDEGIEWVQNASFKSCVEYLNTFNL